MVYIYIEVRNDGRTLLNARIGGTGEAGNIDLTQCIGPIKSEGVKWCIYIEVRKDGRTLLNKKVRGHGSSKE